VSLPGVAGGEERSVGALTAARWILHDGRVAAVPPDRHLLRARDLIDVRYAEPLDIDALARAACASRWHFVRSFRRAFGETPHQYLLTRRMERAAALLRTTDHTVARICAEVGLVSVPSFTASFKRTYGRTPTAYRAAHPPAAARVPIPSCALMAWTRPRDRATLEKPGEPAAGSVAAHG
jgi:AraC-like DNA-binding protein